MNLEVSLPFEVCICFQVAHIDVTSESPVNHGTVICFSIFGGPDLHFAPEEMPSNKNLWKNQIWVDTYFDGNVSSFCQNVNSCQQFFWGRFWCQNTSLRHAVKKQLDFKHRGSLILSIEGIKTILICDI